MIYQILHYFFGWDYISWSNIAADGVARVFKTHDGRVCYWRYKTTKVLDEIKEPRHVKWLTCSPSKYFGDSE